MTTSDRCDTAPSSSSESLKPGQLYVWRFSVGNGFWMFPRVTEEGRHSFVFAHVTVKPGSQLLMLHPDDAGPWEVPEYDNTNGIPYYPKNRWHVMVVEGVMVWV